MQTSSLRAREIVIVVIAALALTLTFMLARGQEARIQELKQGLWEANQKIFVLTLQIQAEARQHGNFVFMAHSSREDSRFVGIVDSSKDEFVFADRTGPLILPISEPWTVYLLNGGNEVIDKVSLDIFNLQPGDLLVAWFASDNSYQVGGYFISPELDIPDSYHDKETRLTFAVRRYDGVFR